MSHILAIGTVVDGLQFVGPFPDNDAAINYGEMYQRDIDWVVAELYPPRVRHNPEDLDEDHPLWLVNEQIKGLMDGDGASEDHEGVLNLLRTLGLPESTVAAMHRAIVHSVKKEALLAAQAQPAIEPDVTYVCPRCGSDKVYFDAYASMNDPDDVQTFDDKACQNCGAHFNDAKEVTHEPT